jgi:hypothetical protein
MMELLAVACLSVAAKMEEVDVPVLLDLQVRVSLPVRDFIFLILPFASKSLNVCVDLSFVLDLFLIFCLLC